MIFHGLPGCWVPYQPGTRQFQTLAACDLASREQTQLKSLPRGGRGETVRDGYPFKTHLTSEPGFVIVVLTLRFPLQTKTNTPFFETAASPGV